MCDMPSLILSIATDVSGYSNPPILRPSASASGRCYPPRQPLSRLQSSKLSRASLDLPGDHPFPSHRIPFGRAGRRVVASFRPSCRRRETSPCLSYAPAPAAHHAAVIVIPIFTVHAITLASSSLVFRLGWPTTDLFPAPPVHPARTTFLTLSRARKSGYHTDAKVVQRRRQAETSGRDTVPMRPLHASRAVPNG